MKSSESLENLADALVRANLVIVNPTKDRTARAGSYSYRYVGLDTITADMRPILQAHGLCIVQEIANDGITTRILHSSGEWLEMGPLNLPGGEDAQSRGSASTYGRRYTYCAALGIAADEDDDEAKAKKTSGGERRVETIAYGEGAIGSKAPPPDSTSAPRAAANRVREGDGEGAAQSPLVGADDSSTGPAVAEAARGTTPGDEGLVRQEATDPSSSGPVDPLANHQHGPWSEKRPDGAPMRDGWLRCEGCGQASLRNIVKALA